MASACSACSAAAAKALGDTVFDYDGAAAIRDELLGIKVSAIGLCLGVLPWHSWPCTRTSPTLSVGLCLGVLPVVQLALHAHIAHHSYCPSETSVLEQLATDVKFDRPALNEFRGAFGAALGVGDGIIHVALYQPLIVAIARDDSTLRGAGEPSILIDGTEISWHELAHASHTKWKADVAGFNGGTKRLPTPGLVGRIRDFATARMKSPFASPVVAPPPIDTRPVRSGAGPHLRRTAPRPRDHPRPSPALRRVAAPRAHLRVQVAGISRPVPASAWQRTPPRRR